MKKLLLLLPLFVIFACDATPVTPPATLPRPAPVTQGVEYCAAAEVNLKRLGCIPTGATYTAKGLTFTEFCQETMSNGINVNPQCLSTVTSCDQANACTNSN